MTNKPQVGFDLKEYLDKQFAAQTKLHESHEKATIAHVAGLKAHVDGVKADVDDLKKGQEKLYDIMEVNGRKLAKFDGELIFIRPIVIAGVIAFLLWFAGEVVSTVC